MLAFADVRKNHGAVHHVLSEEARAALSANLTLETDFYLWARARLKRQIRDLRRERAPK